HARKTESDIVEPPAERDDQNEPERNESGAALGDHWVRGTFEGGRGMTGRAATRRHAARQGAKPKVTVASSLGSFQRCSREQKSIHERDGRSAYGDLRQIRRQPARGACGLCP